MVLMSHSVFTLICLLITSLHRSVHVRPLGQEQPHNLIPPGPDGHQEAVQRISVGFRPSVQQELRAGDVTIGNCEVQSCPPLICVVFEDVPL
uniref:Uncharacterized protein n=1 Tax=Scleropages formosus TaxID=113540 RepID=A0A8D0C759_SCLFO